MIAEPGPAPASLRAALWARVQERGLVVPWTVLEPEIQRPTPEEEPAEQVRREVESREEAPAVSRAEEERRADVLREVRDLISVGRRREAAAALGDMEGNRGWFALSEAALWTRLGRDRDRDAALGRAGALEGLATIGIHLVRGGGLDPGEALKAAGPPPCERVPLVELLELLDRAPEAAALARAIRQRDPRCGGAWEREVLSLTSARRFDEAATVLEAMPAGALNVDTALEFKAMVLRGLGRLKEAADIRETWARRDPKGTARLKLLGQVQRKAYPVGSEGFDERLAHYQALLKKDPEDIVSRYMVGMLLYEARRPRASTEVLEPLLEVLPSEHRIPTYLGANAFLLGDTEKAVKLLDRARALPGVDSHVHRTRADILRDIDRPEAIREMEFAIAAGERSSYQAEVSGNEAIEREAIVALRRCMRDRTPTCPGPWMLYPGEEPARGDATALGWPLLIAGCVLLALGGLRALRGCHRTVEN